MKNQKTVSYIIMGIGAFLLILAITCQIVTMTAQGKFEEFMGYTLSATEFEELLSGAQEASSYFGTDLGSLLGIPQWQITLTSVSFAARIPLFIVGGIVLAVGVVLLLLNGKIQLSKMNAGFTEGVESLKEKAAARATKCESCGKVLVGKQAFCPNCGAKAPEKKKVVKGYTCQSCGASMKNWAKYCSQCGTEQPEIEPECVDRCESCKAELPKGARFCSKCGCSAGKKPEPPIPHPVPRPVPMSAPKVKPVSDTIAEKKMEKPTEVDVRPSMPKEEKKVDKWMKRPGNLE